MPKRSYRQDDCLPPQVLQINNQECPTLFHRVTIPAEIGDDETYPPKPGLYRNTLLVYEANHHVWMYSSDGIPTFISDGGHGVDDYNELTNKPSIEGHELVDDSSLEDIGVIDAIEEALEDYTPTSDLAEVAFSGDYDDLENTPTIPTVNNATLTIQKEGSSIGTFTANSATNTTVNVVETDPTVPSWAKQPTKPTYSYSEITNKPTIPTKTSDLTNDGSDGTSTYVEDNDLATVATSGSYNDLSDKPTIPAAQVNSDWNAASGVAQILNKPSLATVATSGSYDDLIDKPTIPTVNNATLTITQNGASAGTFTANASSDTTIGLTDTTYSDFSGATSSAAGAHGLVPAPSAGDEGKILHGDGTWKDAAAKLIEMSYGENNAWAKFIAAYNAGSIVYCRASSNANPATGSQTRKAFMAYVNNATNPTSVEFQYVRSVSTKTASQPVDQVYVYTLTNASGGTWTVTTRDMGPKLAAGTNTTVSYSNGTYTISATGGGGGGPTVVQAVGTSTTSVMSQNAVTGLIYHDPSTRGTISIGTTNGYEVTGGIQIGDGALAPEDYSIAIGYNARGSDGGYPYKGIAIGANAYVWSEGGVAIGADTSIQAGHSVAIGDKSYVGSLDNEYVVSVGRPSNVSNPFTRRIINVTDPINAQDAATKNYVDTVVGNIETILQTLNSGTGAQ